MVSELTVMGEGDKLTPRGGSDLMPDGQLTQEQADVCWRGCASYLESHALLVDFAEREPDDPALGSADSVEGFYRAGARTAPPLARLARELAATSTPSPIAPVVHALWEGLLLMGRPYHRTIIDPHTIRSFLHEGELLRDEILLDPRIIAAWFWQLSRDGTLVAPLAIDERDRAFLEQIPALAEHSRSVGIEGTIEDYHALSTEAREVAVRFIPRYLGIGELMASKPESPLAWQLLQSAAWEGALATANITHQIARSRALAPIVPDAEDARIAEALLQEMGASLCMMMHITDAVVYQELAGWLLAPSEFAHFETKAPVLDWLQQTGETPQTSPTLSWLPE